jgi:two-component system, chemotaxis family, CheB/CheR fusion protein
MKSKKVTRPLIRQQTVKNSSAKSSTINPRSGRRNPEQRGYVVGIGASAGGLEALRVLFGALASPLNMSFVVVQHLAPAHRSRLVELIGHATRIPVKEAENGVIPDAGVVYVTPPNKDVFLEHGRIVLRAPHVQVGPKPSIDLFFESLADDAGGRAIGIILSGTGSDGAHGIRAIKAAGGITMAQSIASSKYDGMPKAATHTGAVDMELAPEEIAAELARIARLEPPTRYHSELPPKDPYQDIMAVLDRELGASFLHYKQSTILRRMERRILATRSESLKDYAAYLSQNPDEAKRLFQDMLISVTSFFRDPDSFKALNQHIVERLKAKPDHSTFRCWVVGCATGEEAYSIAILLAESIEKLKKHVIVQIFATDLDEQALAIARRAIYPKTRFKDFPRTLREKYFTEYDDGGYQAKGSVREGIVFAKHNVTEDPPFLNLDLVSCRNVLIYFNASLQGKVFKTLHYALDLDGIAFLGRSEAAPLNDGCFELVDKQAKIYRRLHRKGEVPRPISRQDATREAALISNDRRNEATELFHSVIAGVVPDSVLVDDEFRIKHVYGNAASYLSYPAGAATQHVHKLVPHEMGLELVGLLYCAQKTHRTAWGRKRELRAANQLRVVQQMVIPINTSARTQYLVCFQTTITDLVKGKRSRRKNAHLPAQERIKKLEQELASAREHLQTVIEEQETSNEELQALNEELQSANEELETTIEELQSTNEELTTLNQELNVRSSELQALNLRLQAIQGAIVYPLLVVNRNLQLSALNPAARHLFRLNDGDIGAHLKSVPSYLDLQDVVPVVDEALSKESEPRLQFAAKGRSFEVQIQLFRGPRGDVDGAVVSFVENTDIVNALEESRLHRERLSSILENTPAIVTMKDLGGVYVYANRRFCEVTGNDPAMTAGKTDEELFGADVGRAVREHDFEVIKHKQAQTFTETFRLGGAPHIWTSSKFPLLDGKQRVQWVCTIALDISERVMHERQLDLFRRALSASNSGIAILEAGRDGLKTTFVSPQLGATVGVDSRNLIGLALEELLTTLGVDSKPAQLRALADEIRQGPACNFTLAVANANGKDNWIEVRSRTACLDDNGPERLIITVFDVTQRVHDQRTIAAQQDELSHFGRFSAVGEIAEGIAHEINTPLNVITTKTSLLRKLSEKQPIEAPNARKIADDIDQMAKNVSSIVLGLKAVVMRDRGEFEMADLCRLIRNAVKICEFRLQRSGVELRLDLPASETLVECYPVQIVQILINLINNSVDAIGNLGDRWIAIKLIEHERTVNLLITDSGPGIDVNLAEKIMTPFFTTKTEHNGTGIGLSLSRSIARRHGGDLVLDRENKNTSFSLQLAKRQA